MARPRFVRNDLARLVARVANNEATRVASVEGNNNTKYGLSRNVESRLTE